MGRFSKLEIGKGPAAEAAPSKGEPRMVDSIPVSAEHRPDHPSATIGVEELIASGDEAFFGGDEKGALRWYSRALRADEAALPAWIAHIRIQIIRGELGDANAWITRALSVFPTAAPLMALRAENLGRQGRIKQALHASDTLLATREGMTQSAATQIWISRGHLLLIADNRNTDNCFEQAIASSHAADWKIPFWIALICDSERKWSRSAIYYQKALERRTSLPYAWFRLAAARRHLGQIGGEATALAEAEAHCGDNERLRAQIMRAKPGSFIDRIKGLFSRG